MFDLWSANNFRFISSLSRAFPKFPTSPFLHFSPISVLLSPSFCSTLLPGHPPHLLRTFSPTLLSFFCLYSLFLCHKAPSVLIPKFFFPSRPREFCHFSHIFFPPLFPAPAAWWPTTWYNRLSLTVIFSPGWLGARLILVNSGKRAREKRRNDGTKFIARIYKGKNLQRQAAGQEFRKGKKNLFWDRQIRRRIDEDRQRDKNLQKDSVIAIIHKDGKHLQR